MTVGLFDSGVGGLNVLNELLKKYPHNHYIFLGDTKNLPYGDKSIQDLEKLSKNNIDFLINKGAEIIIIACGTVSSTCYDYLKNNYNIPIYDIISPTIDYLNNSNYKNIGVIGTTRTINSNIFDKVNKSIYKKATKDFVPIIENNLQEQSLDIIKDNLKDFNNIDCLVLGCTHYPLLKKEINSILKMPLIDMGSCLANKIKLENESSFKVDLYFSSINDSVCKNIDNILDCDYSLYNIEDN